MPSPTGRTGPDMADQSFLHLETPSSGPESPNSLSSRQRNSFFGSRRQSSHYDPATGKYKDKIVEDPGLHPLLGQASSSGHHGQRALHELEHYDRRWERRHEAPGLDPYRLASNMTTPEPGNERGASTDKTSSRRRKFWVTVGLAVVAILAAVAIALGVVFGRRPNQTGASSPSSTTSPSPSKPTSVPDSPLVNSTRGAWNRTGLVLFPTTSMVGDYYQIYLAYQSYAGTVEMVTVNFSSQLLNNNASNVSNPVQIISSPWPMAFTASPGSNIAGQTIPAGTIPGQGAQHLGVYVATNGTICDAWSPGNSTQNSTDLQKWQFGKLCSMGFQTPTDRRAVLYLQWAPCYGKSRRVGGSYDWGSGGLRLWAGGLDGQIYQYSYDLDSGEWANASVVLKDSYAYGGIAMAQLGANVNCIDRQVLLTTARNGSIMYYTSSSSSSSSSSNDTLWPAGAPWDGPRALPVGGSGIFFAPNSSIVSGVPASIDLSTNDAVNLLAVGTTSLQSIPVDVGVLNSSSSSSSTSGQMTVASVQNISVMPGSAMVSAGFEFGDVKNRSSARGVNLLIYQNNGSSVNWAVLSDADQQISGNILW